MPITAQIFGEIYRVFVISFKVRSTFLQLFYLKMKENSGNYDDF